MREAIDLDEDVPSDVPALLDAARSLVIRTSDDADEAGLLLREIGQRKASVAAWFAPLCEQAHRAWKALTARRGEVLAQFDEPERIVHGALTTYRTAELARQREEEEATRRAALAKAEEARIERAERALEIRIELRVVPRHLLARLIAVDLVPVGERSGHGLHLAIARRASLR